MEEQWRRDNLVKMWAWRAVDGNRPRVAPESLTIGERVLWYAEYDRLTEQREERRVLLEAQAQGRIKLHDVFSSGYRWRGV